MRTPASAQLSWLLRLLLTLALIVAAIQAARADRLRATLGQPLREVAHAVDVRVEGGKAIYRVRRSFANTGKRHDEASLRIELPYGAAATGLRIRAKQRWYDGELLEADKAAAMYRELTGMGPHTPRDPALLQWVWADQVHLQVFPVPPGGTATVEYTLTAPTRYQGGRHVLFYRRHAGAANLAPPVVRVRPERFSGRVSVDGQPGAAGQPVVLRAEPTPAWMAKLPLDGDAGHACSELRVGHRGKVKKVEVTVDLRHTYRGDLVVMLQVPWGGWHTLHNRGGGSDNDLSETYAIEVPRGKRAAGRWRLLVSDHARLDTGSIDGFSVRLDLGQQKRRFAAADTPRVIPDAPEDGANAGAATFEVEPGKIQTLAARLGRVVASKDKAFLRLEVEAAPRLRPLPRAAKIVFVVDASRSIGKAGIAAQLHLARSLLSHVPDARVQLVAFARRAAAVLPAFESPARLPAALTVAQVAGKLTPRNGSALDAGLAAAARLLAHARGPRFVVMLTDALLRPSWRNTLALTQLGRLAGTTAHVVIPETGGSVSERRDDHHPLAPIAARGGGILLRVDGLPGDLEKGPGKQQRRDLDQVTLGLVRPVRIDSFSVRAGGGQPFSSVSETLAEGDGLRKMVKLEGKRAAGAPRAVVLSGKIWAKPYREVVRVDRATTRATAAYVFSLDEHHGLGRAQMLRVARLGRAVSPVTSYLAIEPGVRPSTAGINREALGAGGLGGFGRGGGGAAVRVGRPRPKLAPLLAVAVARCVAQHRPRAGWRVALVVDTTYHEIVDVTRASNASAMARCLVEGAWDLALPASFDRRRDRYRVVLP